ncbi:MAG: hypothetical protein Kow0062_26490 [Acidobacteriota bacterium]
MTARTRRSVPALAVGLACVCGAALAASAEDDALVLLRTGHFQVRVGEAIDPDARIYQSEGVPRLLIDAPRLGAPWLVVAGEKVARRLDAASVAPVADDPDAVRVGAGSDGTEVPITIEGIHLVFETERGRVVVEPAEPLTGDLEPRTLLAALPEYRRGAAAYEPGAGELRLLARVEQPVVVDVFFGSWCPHCEKIVPRIIKLAERLDGSRIAFRFHGLPRKFDEDPLARQYEIGAVPVVLVSRGPKVLARLEGRVLFRPEQALTSVLFGS